MGRKIGRGYTADKCVILFLVVFVTAFTTGVPAGATSKSFYCAGFQSDYRKKEQKDIGFTDTDTFFHTEESSELERLDTTNEEDKAAEEESEPFVQRAEGSDKSDFNASTLNGSSDEESQLCEGAHTEIEVARKNGLQIGEEQDSDENSAAFQNVPELPG